MSFGTPEFSDVFSTGTRWFKVTLPYTSFQAAALTKSVDIFSLPAKADLHYARAVVTVPFVGTTTCTIQVGKVGTTNKYLPASDAKTAASYESTAAFSNNIESMAAATTVSALATATVENLSLLSAGSVDIYILYSQLP